MAVKTKMAAKNTRLRQNYELHYKCIELIPSVALSTMID